MEQCSTCDRFDGTSYCKRYPPTNSKYPYVLTTDWCGEWVGVRPASSPAVASSQASSGGTPSQQPSGGGGKHDDDEQ